VVKRLFGEDSPIYKQYRSCNKINGLSFLINLTIGAILGFVMDIKNPISG